MLKISPQACVEFSCVSQETWKLLVCANEKCLSIDDTPYSLKAEVQFRLRDSYHFPLASIQDSRSEDRKFFQVLGSY